MKKSEEVAEIFPKIYLCEAKFSGKILSKNFRESAEIVDALFFTGKF